MKQRHTYEMKEPTARGREYWFDFCIDIPSPVGHYGIFSAERLTRQKEPEKSRPAVWRWRPGR